LHEDVAPEPLAVVMATLEGDLGRPALEVFQSIEATPLGAGAISQVSLSIGQPLVVWLSV
jgi:predicted unusual protein kinase regulating ubiquinone biosynthesis (AarF/ABC1/UbiB family)